MAATGAMLSGSLPMFRRFAEAELRSHDVDPVYPVLRWLLNAVQATIEEGYWLTVYHLTWYHLGSALRAWELFNRGEPRWPLPKLPTATERRGNRDPRKLDDNLYGWRTQAGYAGGLDRYIDPPLGLIGWESTRARVEAVKGNGRWASYKAAEMFAKVNGLPIVAHDMGHAGSTGPRQGLELFRPGLPKGNKPADIGYIDFVTELWCTETGVDAPIEEMETLLCDWHSLVAGRYYIGHDIDAMQSQLYAVPSGYTDAALSARAATIPRQYLGEYGGWSGPDPDRKQLFKRFGELVDR